MYNTAGTLVRLVAYMVSVLNNPHYKVFGQALQSSSSLAAFFLYKSPQSVPF